MRWCDVLPGDFVLAQDQLGFDINDGPVVMFVVSLHDDSDFCDPLLTTFTIYYYANSHVNSMTQFKNVMCMRLNER